MRAIGTNRAGARRIKTLMGLWWWCRSVESGYWLAGKHSERAESLSGAPASSATIAATSVVMSGFKIKILIKVICWAVGSAEGDSPASKYDLNRWQRQWKPDIKTSSPAVIAAMPLVVKGMTLYPTKRRSWWYRFSGQGEPKSYQQ